MKKICVFCASSSGTESDYLHMSYEFGKRLGKEKYTLVYGGGNCGLMGSVADGVLFEKGQVISVIPRFFVEMGVQHDLATQTHIVETMHERKAMMYDLSSAFVALPGGIGTLDELCEILTWAQLKKHKKACYIFNYNGFYDFFLRHLEQTCAKGFLKREDLDLIKVRTGLDCLFEDLAHQ